MQTAQLIDSGQAKLKSHKRKWSIGLDRSFSEEELQRFLSVVKNEKLRLVYMLQAYLGLRISEAVRVNIRDINFERKEVMVWNVKTKERVTLYLHNTIQNALDDFILKNMRDIEECEGYLAHSKDKPERHISSTYARNRFREYTRIAGLDETYAAVPTIGNQCRKQSAWREVKERRLHRLSTHSLRHYYITRCYNTTKDPLLTQQMARHSSFSSTECYIRLSKNAVREGMIRVFE